MESILKLIRKKNPYVTAEPSAEAGNQNLTATDTIT
jgi:hypothetical protein